PAALALVITHRSLRFGDITFAALGRAVTVVITAVWLALELRHSFHGSTLTGRLDAAEAYTYTVAWTAAALGCLVAMRVRMHVLLTDAALAFLALALVACAFAQGLAFNPLWVTVDVGAWPLLNLIAWGYIVPAILSAAIAREIHGVTALNAPQTA